MTNALKVSNNTSTFVDNMGLPVHGWFRFPAGFSAEWVRKVVQEHVKGNGNVVLLDPFAEVGTAILAGEEAGITSFGLEAQPFIFRVAKAKLLWHTRVDKFLEFAGEVVKGAQSPGVFVPSYPTLIGKCYTEDTLRVLHALKCAWESKADGSPASELTWLALATVLRTCSTAGTAPWQYILPKKSKSKVALPFDGFTLQVNKMATDMRLRQMQGIMPRGEVFYSDARECTPINNGSINLVVTSPPYVNNYDYADATRLEMTFFGDVKTWGDLHEKVRHGLIRSCSQHASIDKLSLDATLESLGNVSIFSEIQEVCTELQSERLNHGGRKAYHTMVAAYFADMYRVWKSLRRVCTTEASICFVIGDSAPYGIYVPVDRWLGELAIAAGFKSYAFTKTRDRNVKWKNRKHRVPLNEGHLWVKG